MSMTTASVTSGKQALVFADEGVNEQSVEALIKQLAAILHPDIQIRKIDGNYLATERWEEITVVLVMGGGVCGKWDERLGDAGVRKIRNYVLNGGKYIGFCAGAYFAAGESHFQIAGSSPIIRKRSLSFFEGRVVGPITETDAPIAARSAHAAQVAFKINGVLQEGLLYYLGGCLFEIEGDREGVCIVGRYESLAPQRTAAVLCTVGQGTAYLSGLHPEFRWKKRLKQSPEPIARLARALHPQEPFRQQVWEEIGKMLSLPMKDQVEEKLALSAPMAEPHALRGDDLSAFCEPSEVEAAVYKASQTNYSITWHVPLCAGLFISGLVGSLLLRGHLKWRTDGLEILKM